MFVLARGGGNDGKERSMGDKGGKKDKAKSQTQMKRKQDQKSKALRDKQQKSAP